jgi:hypothetical protein
LQAGINSIDWTSLGKRPIYQIDARRLSSERAANTKAHLNTCGAVLASFWSKLRRRYCYMHAKKNHLKVVFFFI